MRAKASRLTATAIALLAGFPRCLEINPQEVEEVMENPGEDRPGKEGSRVVLGKTSGGRYLRVIYVPDEEPGSIFVITAYNLTGKPLSAFLRRRRRRK
ncbi:MAG: DUF4258 domain-containing protein [Proteobacteria bacterium]|nr:DUF4258 domain-containing protein [Pseudomonadota bacterium]